MDQSFQTSFIPKKPVVEERTKASRPMGLFTIIGIFIFVSMALSYAGLYFYKGILTKNITEMEKNLTLAKNRFEPEKISQLKLLDRRLRSSNEILLKHIAVSPIFKALSQVTLKTVRYTKFSYDLAGDKNSQIFVKLNGQAVGYRSVALQADILAKDERVNKHIIDPVFSNLSLDDKGNVLFDLEFFVDADFVDYRQALETESPANSVIENVNTTTPTTNTTTPNSTNTDTKVKEDNL